jgi:tetratricopeptide (TPR) repeat protein
VRSEGEGQAATGPVFETAEAKYRAALESFQQVADEFSGYDAGRKARYYIGLCHAALAEYEEAISVLSELRSGDRDLGYYLATKSLAQVQAASGDYVGAASTLRTLVEDSANPLPMDFLLFDLAKAEERAGNTAQARQYYERVLEEFPQSQIRGDVTARRDLLDLELQS